MLGPINVQLTFYKNKDDKSGYLTAMTTALGKSIINIQDKPLQLQGIVIKDILDAQTNISQKLYEHYYMKLFFGVLRLIGSLDYFGNPVGLISDLGSGVKDFIDLPMKYQK